MGRSRISAAEARRIALAAQGFARQRPAGRIDSRHFRRVLDTLGALQLDYVNVLLPAHYLVLWSRLGGYDRSRFDRFAYATGEYTEQWAHEASIVPARSWPLLAHRRQAYEIRPYNPLRRLENRGGYLDAVLEQVAREGPVTAQDLPPLPGPRRRPGDWHRSMQRWALEFHFGRGSLAVAARRPNYQRVYDLPERVLAEPHLTRSYRRADAERELLDAASRSLGVATLRDLADYYRMSSKRAGPRVAELVEDGVLTAVEVEGWKEPAYLAAGARLPRRMGGASLLSPFDPVLWYRPRAERLFDFHYRLEIYVPREKRKWGYYVLPFRIGDRIVARVDLKADRQASRLLVLAAHAEPGTRLSSTAPRLAVELRALADWLQLDAIEVTRHNRFSRVLAQSCENLSRDGF